MDEKLKDFILGLNCSIINPIKASIRDDTVVGWVCKSSSILRHNETIRKVKSFILENNIEVEFVDGSEHLTDFYIYKNKQI